MNEVEFRGWTKMPRGGNAWELILKEARSLHIL